MKKHIKAFVSALLNSARDDFWMWSAIVSVVFFHAYDMGIGFAVYAFYDKIASIQEMLRDKGVAPEVNIGTVNFPDIKLAMARDGEEHF